MTTQTNVVWLVSDLTPELQQITADQISLLVSQGKTDGVNEIPPIQSEDQRTFIRSWTTTQDANDWITFLNALATPPISAVIVTNP